MNDLKDSVILGSPWRALEQIRGLSAVPAIWRWHLGQHFDSFRRAFLLARAEPAKHFPCEKCGCAHQIIPTTEPLPLPIGWGEGRGEGFLHAVCTCEPWNCPDLILAPDEVQVLELNWPRFARALCQVFALHQKFTDLHIPNTVQIGSWSAEAVPAILTIQSDPKSLRSVVCELIARLRGRFILIAPTNQHLDATCLEPLANADAGFFALENLVAFDGSLRLMGKVPGELFARFSGQPKEVEEDVARRAFALIQALDLERGVKPPSLLAVFRLYCIEELSAEHIARIQHCSKATVIGRLNQIRARTGVDPQHLRKVSGHLKKIEEEFSDSRASHIHRKKLIYDGEEDANED